MEQLLFPHQFIYFFIPLQAQVTYKRVTLFLIPKSLNLLRHYQTILGVDYRQSQGSDGFFAISNDHNVLTTTIPVQISFKTLFNSVNIRLKDAGQNSHRFAVVGAWPSYASFTTLIGFEPIRIPLERIQRQSAVYLCPPLFLCTQYSFAELPTAVFPNHCALWEFPARLESPPLAADSPILLFKLL